VRSQGDTARIELPAEQIIDFVNQIPLPDLVEKFQELGFLFVTLDLEGLQSGKLNRVLGIQTHPPTQTTSTALNASAYSSPIA
jgi:uncharacterized protein